jgi:two-component system sensor histidine kinase PilS (NtrC family)
VTLANTAAIKLLKKDRIEVEQVDIKGLSPSLYTRIEQWKTQKGKSFPAFSLTGQGPVVVITLYSLSDTYGDNTLIFIEDLSAHLKASQEVKLAAMGRLTATIAHEIRNPLMAISHSAQLLSESTYLKKQDKHLLKIIEENTKRTNAVTENILLLSRAKAATPIKIELLSWLEHLLIDFKIPNERSLQMTLDVAKEITVIFDVDQFRQVLVNLIDNAARYSFQSCGEAKVMLKGGTLSATEKMTYLDIIDYGAGVPDDLQSAIFEPFFTTDHKGNGLGLFVVKSLCELNKAEISYRPDEQNRSCFRMIFSNDVNEISTKEGEQ